MHTSLDFPVLINGDFEVDRVSKQRYGITYLNCPTGWRCSCGRDCSKTKQDPLGRVIVVGSQDLRWGGGKAPSGNNYISIQSINGRSSYIEQAIGAATKAFMVQFFARARPSKHNQYKCNVVLEVSYCGVAYWTSHALDSKWTSFSIAVQPACASSSVPKTLRFTEVTNNRDCTAQVDAIKLKA